MDAPITTAQMYRLEQAAMADGRVTGRDLMERAGQGALHAINAQWPHLHNVPGTATLLCGPGNNGGDGFVLARLLATAGWQVRPFLIGDPLRLPPDARANYDLCPIPGVTLSDSAPGVINEALITDPPPDIVVDALFGIGLSRPIRGTAAAVVQTTEMLRGAGAKVVSIDIPSGLNADTGRALGPVITADLTVTFHRMKIGHVLADGPALCGNVVVWDIGL